MEAAHDSLCIVSRFLKGSIPHERIYMYTFHSKERKNKVIKTSITKNPESFELFGNTAAGKIFVSKADKCRLDQVQRGGSMKADISRAYEAGEKLFRRLGYLEPLQNSGSNRHWSLTRLPTIPPILEYIVTRCSTFSNSNNNKKRDICRNTVYKK